MEVHALCEEPTAAGSFPITTLAARKSARQFASVLGVPKDSTAARQFGYVSRKLGATQGFAWKAAADSWKLQSMAGGDYNAGSTKHGYLTRSLSTCCDVGGKRRA